MKTPHVSFNYPINFEYDYIFPTKYYLNVQTGHSIIKREQINIAESVSIGKDGEIEVIENDD